MGGGGNKGWERDSAWFTHWEGEIKGGIYVGEENEGPGGRRNWTRGGTRVVSVSHGVRKGI